MFSKKASQDPDDLSILLKTMAITKAKAQIVHLEMSNVGSTRPLVSNGDAANQAKIFWKVHCGSICLHQIKKVIVVPYV
jgi:Ni,Fe-hydrogenase III small subunit